MAADAGVRHRDAGRPDPGPESLGDAVTVHSKAPDRTATLLMALEGRDAREAQAHLAARDVVAPSASFYAYEPFTALKLEAPALRAGPGPLRHRRRRGPLPGRARRLPLTP